MEKYLVQLVYNVYFYSTTLTTIMYTKCYNFVVYFHAKMYLQLQCFCENISRKTK